jgi:4'-phosphopantetheinyl transferase
MTSFVAHWVTEADRCEVQDRRHAAVALLARAALRALLARETGRADWQLVRSPLGKPFMVGPDGRPGPSVSLSHTAGIVAVALAADGALGVDIEHHRPRDFTRLASQAFGEVERAAVARGGAEAFYHIWTLREAIAKATGEGLAITANGRDLLAGLACGSEVSSDYAGRIWRLHHVRLAHEMTLALAHADPREDPNDLRWIELGVEPLMQCGRNPEADLDIPRPRRFGIAER